LSVPCKAGVQSTYPFTMSQHVTDISSLDALCLPVTLIPKKHGRCSQPHTEILVEECKLGLLWDEYGLVGDIVVSSFFSLSFAYISSLYHMIVCSFQMADVSTMHGSALCWTLLVS
jgi:hypothetical protein